MFQYKGQGRIFEKCGTKISKKNNLKQKSYEDFSVLKIKKINKSTKNLMIPIVFCKILEPGCNLNVS